MTSAAALRFRTLSFLRGLFLLRRLARLSLSTFTFLSFTPGLLDTSSGGLSSRFYRRVGLTHQPFNTRAVLFLTRFPLPRPFSLCFFLASLPLCSPATSRIKYCLAYVTGADATQAIATTSVAIAANTAVHETDVMPSTTVLHKMNATQRTQPLLEGSLGAVSHRVFPAGGLGAVHLFGIVNVHQPERGREMPTTLRACSEMAPGHP